MTNAVLITVPGKPVAKARPRTVRIKSGGVRTYTPKNTVDFERHGRQCAILAMKGTKPLIHPIICVISVELPIPASWSKKKKQMAVDCVLRPTTRPDLDNYVKGLLDCCNEIVFKDDSQVVDMIVSKTYSHSPKSILYFAEIPNNETPSTKPPHIGAIQDRNSYAKTYLYNWL